MNDCDRGLSMRWATPLLGIILLVIVGCASQMPLYELPDRVITKFDDERVSVSGLADDDINQDFNNIDDLRFLPSLVGDRELVLIGEMHYFSKVSQLINRIIFSLIKKKHFSFVSVEAPYSLSPFLNHYVHIVDDQEATDFRQQELKSLVLTNESIFFLEHIRRWNKRHSDQIVSVGAHDIEFHNQRTITSIIIPYLERVVGTDEERHLKEAGSLDSFEWLYDQLDKAESRHIIGRHPFITARYIRALLRNIEAMDGRDDGFYAARQRVIIENLSSDDRLGGMLKTNKSILHGGGHHMRTRSAPDEGDFYWEGEYFNHINADTKGECFSISISGVAINYKNVVDLPSDHTMSGTGRYQKAVMSFLQKYENDSNAIGRYYAMNAFNDFRNLLIKKAEDISANVIRLNQLDRSGILRDLQTKKIAQYPAIRREIDYLGQFDANVYIIRSGIWKALASSP